MRSPPSFPIMVPKRQVTIQKAKCVNSIMLHTFNLKSTEAGECASLQAHGTVLKLLEVQREQVEPVCIVVPSSLHFP